MSLPRRLPPVRSAIVVLKDVAIMALKDVAIAERSDDIAIAERSDDIASYSNSACNISSTASLPVIPSLMPNSFARGVHPTMVAS